MSHNELTKWRELIACVIQQHGDDGFFSNFDVSVEENPQKRAYYLAYEKAFQYLDTVSWARLIAKAVLHYPSERDGQRKQPFFDQLADALAYQHLAMLGCTGIEVLEESTMKTTDLAFFEGGIERYCEVKSSNVSNDLIERRQNRQAGTNVYTRLSEGFLEKLGKTLANAQTQIDANGTGLIYLIVHFDDFTPDNLDVYRLQIIDYLGRRTLPEIYVRVGLFDIDPLHIKRVSPYHLHEPDSIP